MLKIKLARFGKRKQPHYRIVVNEARDKRDGRYIALLGQYAPTLTPKILNVDMDAYREWMKKGAQPTETVESLIKRYETGTPFPERKPGLSKKAKAKEAAAKEAEANPVEATPAAEAEPAAEATPTETPEIAETSAEPAAEAAPQS